MLMGDEHYVIVKFTSGEQVMAVLVEETLDDVTIVYPMQIRLTPILDADGAREHVTATPWNKFADDPQVTINKRNVLFIKNLHHVLIPHYTRLVSENEETQLVNKKENRAEDLTWGDEETQEEVDALSNEEILKRIRMLESIAEKEETVFVEGNDTIH
jgi:hypothetical protein